MLVFLYVQFLGVKYVPLSHFLTIFRMLNATHKVTLCGVIIFNHFHTDFQKKLQQCLFQCQLFFRASVQSLSNGELLLTFNNTRHYILDHFVTLKTSLWLNDPTSRYKSNLLNLSKLNSFQWVQIKKTTNFYFSSMGAVIFNVNLLFSNHCLSYQLSTSAIFWSLTW